MKLADLSSIALISLIQFKKLMHQDPDLSKKTEYEKCGDTALVLFNFLNRFSDSLDSDKCDNLMVTCQV